MRKRRHRGHQLVQQQLPSAPRSCFLMTSAFAGIFSLFYPPLLFFPTQPLFAYFAGRCRILRPRWVSGVGEKKRLRKPRLFLFPQDADSLPRSSKWHLQHHPFIHPSIHPFVHPSIRPFVFTLPGTPALRLGYVNPKQFFYNLETRYNTNKMQWSDVGAGH